MSIKKQLRISNIIMIILPCLLILVTGALLSWFLFNDKYDEEVSTEELTTYISSVNGELEDFFDSTTLKSIESGLTKEIVINETENYREKQASNQISYLFYLNDELIIEYYYQNEGLSEKTTDVINSSKDYLTFTFSFENTAIIKDSLLINDDKVTVILINQNVKSVAKPFTFRFYSFYIIIAGFIIMGVNVILTRHIMKRIVTPLNLLDDSAKKIIDGDTSTRITYDRKDEFATVVMSFNKMLDRLENSLQEIYEEQNSKKELIAGISHDIRTPLTSIKGYVEGIQDGIANTDEKRRKYLDVIYQKTCDMEFLLDKLFMFSKLDAGYYPFALERVNAYQYFEECLSMCIKEFSLDGLEITKNIELAETLFIHIDKKEIKRVIENILSNSVKYCVSKKPKVEISVYFEKKHLTIKVKDNGDVAVKAINKIFNSFYRADQARSNPDKGTGLGLSISKMIIEAHAGKIQAKNENGLAVYIYLPTID